MRIDSLCGIPQM